MQDMKMYQYIKRNKDRFINSRAFSNRDLYIISRTLNDRKYRDFNLNKAQRKFIIDDFIRNSSSFDDDTPYLIRSSIECIKSAIKSDINNLNFISFNWYDSNGDLLKETELKELEKYFINEAVKNDYVLCRDSPYFLAGNFDVIKKSIRIIPSSANYIDWSLISNQKSKELIDEIIENNYVLTYKSSKKLYTDERIIFNSIKKDFESFIYANRDTIFQNKELFQYILISASKAIKNMGVLIDNILYNAPISNLLDEQIMSIAIKYHYQTSIDENGIKLLTKLYTGVLKNPPTIRGFDAIFDYYAEINWNKFKQQNANIYENVFNKICSEIKGYHNFIDFKEEIDVRAERDLGYDEEDEEEINDSFDDINDDFDFGDNFEISGDDTIDLIIDMKNVLGEYYSDLENAIKEYINIYNSDAKDKLNKIIPIRDTISKFASLYVSKSKDNYKNEQKSIYYKQLSKNFTVRLDSPIIEKKIIMPEGKRRLKKLYMNGESTTNQFLENLIRRYSSNVSEEIVKSMIKEFIMDVDNKVKLENIVSYPTNYNQYLRYQEVTKLIHRLNSGYLKYNDNDITNYKDLIGFDNKNGKYYYTGVNFNEKDIVSFKEYFKLEKVFLNIKKDIVSYIKRMDIDVNDNRDLLDNVIKKLPFSDSYFKFDMSTVNHVSFATLVGKCFVSPRMINKEMFNSEIYPYLYDALVNNNLIWDIMIGINKFGLSDIIQKFEKILNMARATGVDLRKLNELMLLADLVNSADQRSIAILGPDVIYKICHYRSYTCQDEKKSVRIAEELVSEMAKRSFSTVPYISGEYQNYRYSMYDSQDESICLSGINTNACFRVGGSDNDFLHYCALNKNGFIIKITDLSGNFVGRASGFRNGNSVFINQLRTIFDEGGVGYQGTNDNEQNDIIDVFKKACNDIIEISQKNDSETTKIDFVFATESYALSSHNNKVNDDIFEKIGDEPMDNESNDWIDFVRNTKNLEEADKKYYFTTDYGEYDIILVASTKKIDDIIPDDLHFEDVPALYERKRNKIIVTNETNSLNIRKINKIKGINSKLTDIQFNSVEIPNNAILFIGDNWYIVVNDKDIVDSLVLDFDNKAKREFETVKKVIYEGISKDNLTKENFVKALKLN